LVREALDVAVRAGRAVAQATATETASTIPLGALSHLLPVGSAGVTSGVELLRQARLALGARSGRQKLVLCVDDAHLLDPVLATLVQQLVMGDTAVVFVTVRTGEVAPDAVTALWKDHGCAFLELQPLSRVEVRDLLESVLGGALEGRAERALWEASRGVPLVLRELVLDGLERAVLVENDGLWRWHGELRAGPRLRELVAGRLGRIGDEDREVLEVVAFGEPVGSGWLGESSRVERLVERGCSRRGEMGGGSRFGSRIRSIGKRSSPALRQRGRLSSCGVWRMLSS
jgi:hypothetical protein